MSERRFERRLMGWAIALALPAAVCGGWLIWRLSFNEIIRGALVILWCGCVTALVRGLRACVVAPLQGLTNVIEAYRGGDYTIRGAREAPEDALGDLIYEINRLGSSLHAQRLSAMEATALLDKLIEAIDVAVFAFDGERNLRLHNPAAVRLLGELASERPLSAESLGLAAFVADEVRSRVVTSIAGRVGRWQVIHGTFREGGLAQHLLIVSDVRQALREEERAAWQRLIRVIGHEVNNSLTPIKSMAQSLQELLGQALPTGSMREDTVGALKVMAERTTSLGRFLGRYGRLARLPPARRRWQLLAPVLERVTALEPLQRIVVDVSAGLEANVDEDQLEQALINLCKNAVEAQQSDVSPVRLTVEARGGDLQISVWDEGPGIANVDNLFVPFFTTKPTGSGIGLVLSRQIAEAHEGTLTLENRRDRTGAVAVLDLPHGAREQTPMRSS